MKSELSEDEDSTPIDHGSFEEFYQCHKGDCRVKDLPENVKRKILVRCHEADDKEIKQMAVQIGYYNKDNLFVKHQQEPDKMYNDGGAPGYSETEIRFKDEIVYKQICWGLPDIYLPGPWENQLRGIYLIKQRKEKAKERLAKQAKTAQEKAEIKKQLAGYGL